jgi:hypothetical protein
MSASDLFEVTLQINSIINNGILPRKFHPTLFYNDDLLKLLLGYPSDLIRHIKSSRKNYTEFCTIACTTSPSAINLIPMKRRTKELYKIVLPHIGELIIRAPEFIRNDPEMLIMAINSKRIIAKIHTIESTRKLVDNYEEVAMALIDRRPDLVYLLKREILTGEDERGDAICRAVVSTNGFNLRHFGKKYTQMREICELAAKNNWMSIEFMDDSIRNDIQFAMFCMNIFGSSIAYFSDEIKNNKNVCIAALMTDGLSLRCMNDDIKNNYEYAKLAVTQNGNAMEYVGESLKNDRLLCTIAVKKSGVAWKYIGTIMQNDYDLCLNAVKTYPYAFENMNDKMKNDKAICMIIAAQKNTGDLISFASKEMLSDYDVCFTAITNNFQSMKYINLSFYDNKEFCLAALKCYLIDISFLSPTLRDDDDIFCACVSHEKSIVLFDMFSSRIRNNNGACRSIKYLPSMVFSQMGEEVRRDKEMCLKAVKYDSTNLEYISNDMFNDEEIALVAMMSKNINYYAHRIRDELKNSKKFMAKVFVAHPELKEFIAPLLKDYSFIREYTIALNRLYCVYDINEEFFNSSSNDVLFAMIKHNVFESL